MRRILGVVALLVAAFNPIPSLAANTWGTDMSDLWWNDTESGWGANVAHQGEVIFMTLFVYGADSKVRWYVASDMVSRGGADPLTFDGPLYETTGPYLGAVTFDASSIGTRAVGTATLRIPNVNSGTLSYTVDGVSVAKAITRHTFRSNDLSGSYAGAETGSVAGCAGSLSGAFQRAAQFDVVQSGNSIAITATLGAGLVCTYAGNYFQSGRMGHIAGTISCNDGASGSFDAVEIEASYLGFFGRYFADMGGTCTERGRLGGVKR
jgi:hypothetical protein